MLVNGYGSLGHGLFLGQAAALGTIRTRTTRGIGRILTGFQLGQQATFHFRGSYQEWQENMRFRWQQRQSRQPVGTR
jgi:hypothetical protein